MRFKSSSKRFRPEFFTVTGIWARLALVDIKLQILSPHKRNSWLYKKITEILPPLDPALRAQALHMEKLVARAAAHPFFFNMSCLRRALVLRSLLEAQNIPSHLVFGMRRFPKAHKPEAHAWLDLGDFCLGLGTVSEKPDFIPFKH